MPTICYFIFFWTFSIGLLIANIVCFIKKKYLYLFIPCMLFLPEYYGIEFSESLPILTVTRMMFLVFYLYAIINRRRDISLKNINLKTLPKEYFFLSGYFVFRIISNLYYITTYGQAAKTIFEIVFEQLFLLIAVWMLAPTKDEMNKLIKVIVYVAAVMFVMGIVESLSGVRIVDALYTMNRYMLNNHYIRLGLLRATVSLGLANFYGNMCILILPLIFMLVLNEKKIHYLLILALNILAIIHSGCRSDLFFLILITFVYNILIIHDMRDRIFFLKNICSSLILVAFIITILSISNVNYQYFYIGTIKSGLNEIGFEFDLDKDAPPGVNGYGTNAESGTDSRLVQLSAISYASEKNPIFGLGSGAQNRGDVYFLQRWGWQQAFTLDMGYVEVPVCEGLLGVCGYFSLLIFALLISKKSSRNKSHITDAHFIILVYLLCMLSTTNMANFLFFYIMLELTCVTNVDKN